MGDIRAINSKLLTICVAILLVASIGIAHYWFIATDRATGNVGHKSMFGVKDGTAYQLVEFVPHGLFIDSAVVDIFAGYDIDMVATQTMVAQLEDMGYDIYYVGNIQLSSMDNVNGVDPGETMGYILESMDDFNQLHLGNDVSFDIFHNERVRIKNVHLLV